MKIISSKLKAQSQKLKTKKCSDLIMYCIVFLLAFSFWFLASPVSAQQVTLSIDPPIVQAKIKPGKAILVAYTIENKGDPTTLQFLIRPFIPVGQQGSLTVSPQMEGPIQFNLENADVVLEKPFFFASNEKRQAVVRVYVPSGIPDGDYYFMIMAETVPAFSLGGQSTGVASASLGSPLLISVTDSGITEIKAQVAEFSFHPDTVVKIGNKLFHIVDSAESVSIIGSVRNMGVHLLQPSGIITHRFGTTKTEYKIVPQNILSSSQRIIKVEGELAGEAGSTVTLSHLTIGTHTVSAAIMLGDDSSTHYENLAFLVLPIGLMKTFFIALCLLAFYFLFRFFTRKRTH